MKTAKRKVLSIFLLSIFTGIIAVCIILHISFNKVEIENLGSFWVPSDWVCHEDDDIIYFTDNSGKVVMKQWNEAQNIDISTKTHIYGVVYSNGVYWSKDSLTLDGVQGEYYCLDFGTYTGRTPHFIIYDKTVTESTVKIMAFSFNKS